MKCDWSHLYTNLNNNCIIIFLPHNSLLHSKAQNTCLIQISSWKMNVDFPVIISIVFKRTSESKFHCDFLFLIRVPSVKALYGDFKKPALLLPQGKAGHQSLKPWGSEEGKAPALLDPLLRDPWGGGQPCSLTHRPLQPMDPEKQHLSMTSVAQSDELLPFQATANCNIFSRTPFTEMKCYCQGPVF